MYFENQHTEDGGVMWRSASRRSYDLSVLIFVFLDPKNLYFDILHHVLSKLTYFAFRGWRSKLKSASNRLYTISVLIFAILDTKNLYFDILHHVLSKLTYLAFRGWRSK